MSTYTAVKDSGQRQEFTTGSVRDTQTGKGRYDLTSPIVNARDAQHYENGAKKYGDRNWEKGQPLSRFLDSALRHINNYREGDRSEDHLAAARWNLAGVIHTEEMIQRGLLPKELNDLTSYVKPPEAAALEAGSTVSEIIPKRYRRSQHGRWAGDEESKDTEWFEYEGEVYYQRPNESSKASSYSVENFKLRVESRYFVPATEYPRRKDYTVYAPSGAFMPERRWRGYADGTTAFAGNGRDFKKHFETAGHLRADLLSGVLKEVPE